MIDDLRERVSREKQSYDVGNVFEENARLQARFAHVYWCRNSQHAEEYFVKAIRQRCSGKSILSYGSVKGGGLMPALIDSHPKRLVVIDISEKEVQETKQEWDSAAEFHVMDGHALAFPDQSFDVVVGKAILHHMDFAAAIDEIRRILKPGGSALFVEPLRDNPFLKLARTLTPKARTPDGHEARSRPPIAALAARLISIATSSRSRWGC
jgi:ubiquinone/menaquinone biosynthesis C-methylase UbiE